MQLSLALAPLAVVNDNDYSFVWLVLGVILIFCAIVWLFKNLR